MYIDRIVNLSSRAWSLPILSAFHSGVAGRQAPLLKATGANRTAFAQSVDHLIKVKLLERNPGHGHPLRPEFRLTDKGKSAANLAHKIYHIPQEEDRDLLRKTWTLPILTSLHAPGHFNTMTQTIGSISDRALSQSLKTLEARHWIVRSIEDSRPPRSLYTAINTGERVSAALFDGANTVW